MATSTASRLASGMCLRQRYLIQSVQQRTLQSSTYVALDQDRLNRPCLLMEFPVKSSDPQVQEKAVNQFRHAAVPLFQLNHPQLPHFSGAFRHGQSLFLVQNQTEGVSYRDLLEARQAQGKTLTEPEVLHLLVHLLPALDKMHQRQVIHGRISPDSLICPLVSSASEAAGHAILPEAPLLVGLGSVDLLARNLTAVQVGKKVRSAIVGLAGYAPPEQMQTGRIYPHSDLYMLAVSCLVLLTGHNPQDLLDGQTLAWNWQPHITLSPEFEDILETMLAWQPGDRYPTAQAALEEARPALQQINSHRFPVMDTSPQLPFPMSIQPITVQEVLSPHDHEVESPNPFQSHFPPSLEPDSFEMIRPRASHWAMAVGLGLSVGIMAATATFLSPASISPLGALSSDRTGLLRPIALPEQFTLEGLFDGMTVQRPHWMAQLEARVAQTRWRRGSAPGSSTSASETDASAPEVVFSAPMIVPKGEEQATEFLEESDAIAEAALVDDVPVPIYFDDDSDLQSISGTLYELRSQTYLLVAEAGQELAVRLDAVDAELSILDGRRHPVEFEAELTQQWRGELPWSDRYFITVFGKGEYRLNVQLKEAAERF